MDGAALTASFEAARGLLRQNRPAEALAMLDTLLKTAPGHLPSRVSRGSALLALDRHDEAEANWRDALKAHQHHEVLVWNLGSLLMERDRPDDAMALADTVLQHRPTQARALLLRADVLARRGRFEEALETYRLIPRADGIAAELLTKQALALAALQRHDEALALLDEAIALRPDDRVAPLRRAIVRLGRRDFGGWADYEARWRMPGFVESSGPPMTHQIAAQLMLGPTREQLAGQRVLLLGEQGIGDQVMFASLVPELKDAAASVTCVCDPRLVSLFTASFPGIGFARPRDARISASEIDKIVAMGSLGGTFRPTEAAFPGVPYLAPRAEVRARWAKRLGPRSRPLRVGLSWRGGAPTTRRSLRSLGWAELAPILDLPDCEFVSLQYGDVNAELATAPVPIRVFPASEIEDFEELAGLVAELDIVVSVQTALVHLCGAIGQTCLTLIPHNPEWRYGASGSTMPWYRSVRLFRQANPGEWGPVVAQAADALRARLAAP
jgi:tetratricopeptide (TPR) repeat protein